MDEDDWDNLSHYCNSLKPFVEAVKFFSGENFPTAPAVIPFLDEVDENICQNQYCILLSFLSILYLLYVSLSILSSCLSVSL